MILYNHAHRCPFLVVRCTTWHGKGASKTICHAFGSCSSERVCVQLELLTRWPSPSLSSANTHRPLATKSPQRAVLIAAIIWALVGQHTIYRFGLSGLGRTWLQVGVGFVCIVGSFFGVCFIICCLHARLSRYSSFREFISESLFFFDCSS